GPRIPPVGPRDIRSRRPPPCKTVRARCETLANRTREPRLPYRPFQMRIARTISARRATARDGSALGRAPRDKTREDAGALVRIVTRKFRQRKVASVIDLDTFRNETRAWLDANCPPSMRAPGSEDETVWGGRRETFPNPESKIWLARMAERGWTCPMW